MRNFPYKHPASTIAVVILFACGAASADLPYAPRIEGGLPQQLRAELEGALEVFTRQSEVPVSEVHLRRRAARDEEKFLRMAHALGYFAATLGVNLDTAQRPALLLLRMELGPQYTFGSVQLDTTGNLITPDAWRRALGLEEGAPAISADIRAAESRLLRAVRDSGRPFPVITNRDIAVDHASRRANVIFSLDPGPSAVFGQTTVQGLDSVKDRAVLRVLPWKPGDAFDARLLDEAQREILALDLFSVAEIETAPAAGGDGALPIIITVSERKHRSVGVGVEYTTDDGPGVQFNWQHRNVQGLGRPLSLRLSFNPRIWSMDASYKLEPFLDPAQSLTLRGQVKTEDIDAYDAQITRFGGLAERKLSDNLSLYYGAGIHLSHVVQLRNINDYYMAYAEGGLNLDRTDDTLDPARGYRIRLNLSPYAGFDLDPIFARGDIAYSHYWRLNRAPESGEADRPLVLATRLRLGTIFGEDWRRIPADLRWYSGGGAALRGYPYRTVSGAVGSTPIGGESLYEFAVELRKKVSENIGLAFFVENGTAFNGKFSDALGDGLWSVGLGGRYYSPVGPMRLDIAVPLDRREGIDHLFQVYFSIGQAF